MSIHYLLDGYNVIHQMPSALDLAKLEDRRFHLIRFVEQNRPQGSVNNRVTIVFDGNVDCYGGMKTSAAKIVFSQGMSADDEIKKIVAQAKNPKDVIVVSDDRDVQYAVRALGAKTCGVKAFLAKGHMTGKGAAKEALVNEDFVGRPSQEAEKYISKKEEFKITSEFSRIWLDPKRKREYPRT